MNKYSSYTNEQIEELLSYYLIDSWSYSKVSSFARNEKEFEKTYVYYERSKRSSSTIAGNAYHAALEFFFNSLNEGVEPPIVDLELTAYGHIDEVPANEWKLQKTTPTVEECRIKATKSASALIRNFYDERSLYISPINEIVGVEFRLDEWILVNGVDIPLPCHAVIDLAIKDKNGKIIIIDHKTRSKYTDDDELAFVCGKQAITYVKCFESKFANTVSTKTNFCLHRGHDWHRRRFFLYSYPKAGICHCTISWYKTH